MLLLPSGCCWTLLAARHASSASTSLVSSTRAWTLRRRVPPTPASWPSTAPVQREIHQSRLLVHRTQRLLRHQLLHPATHNKAQKLDLCNANIPNRGAAQYRNMQQQQRIPESNTSILNCTASSIRFGGGGSCFGNGDLCSRSLCSHTICCIGRCC